MMVQPNILLWASVLALFLSFSNATNPNKYRCSATADKHRIFVMSDITNEPDDAMSFVRMVAHSDMYIVEGLVATTSWSLNSTTAPEAMEDIINAYETVRPNLQTHTDGKFPTAKHLLSKLRSGPKTYGMYAIEDLEAGGKLSGGAQLLIKAVDASDERLYVMIWGGPNTLAEALWWVRKTRSRKQLDKFISRLSVYAISDQDNSGAWIRLEFPNLRYIVSVHGWIEYNAAEWVGRAGPVPGPVQPNASPEWLAQNIQIGPLGTKYPDILYGMEGDTPSLLYTMQNGLNVPEHPEYGGWGGRYIPANLGHQLFSDAVDTYTLDNQTYVSPQASLFRWLDHYQNEFAARMQWTLRPRGPGSNTSHPPIIALDGSCSHDPLDIKVKANSTLTLDATGTFDQDTGRVDTLNVTWFQYTDATTYLLRLGIPMLEFNARPGTHNLVVDIPIPSQTSSCKQVSQTRTKNETLCEVWHVVLQVTGSGSPPMTRYRRAVVQIKPDL